MTTPRTQPFKLPAPDPTPDAALRLAIQLLRDRAREVAFEANAFEQRGSRLPQHYQAARLRGRCLAAAALLSKINATLATHPELIQEVTDDR